jgi:hypothetical protein
MDLLARDFRLAARHLKNAWPFALLHDPRSSRCGIDPAITLRAE